MGKVNFFQIKVVITVLMELVRFLTNGRPMVPIRTSTFRSSNNEKKVYLFRDDDGRIWLAKGKWSISRTRMYWNPYYGSYLNRPPSIEDKLRKEIFENFAKRMNASARYVNTKKNNTNKRICTTVS